ncbi:hypothetical protein C8A05DRAFT_39563 [Staphylotrichum tortipilum]|uniref:Uncharacterized protein n=1 Tax=Staphylotrichum tortipilum TaxID=2831512 RepID=A0AAN6MAL6_9PEZI|nr:hypothetical protein C8A05DRAFT_39563 [Staphylotrichum longicolle]
MRGFLLASALSGLCRVVAGSGPGDFVDLVPVPRYVWDPYTDAPDPVEKRQDIDDPEVIGNVTLTGSEQMLWTTGPWGPGANHSTIVSLITYVPQEQRIIDMARFVKHLVEARCTEDMMLQFKNYGTFNAARNEWEWANYNDMRSFIIVLDTEKCGANSSTEPWIVNHARYIDANMTIFLNARRTTWKSVASNYFLDFGTIPTANWTNGPPWNGNPKDTNNAVAKRWDVGGAFTLNLASTWPRTFINQTWGAASFTVACVECGVTGGIEFSGHIEGSIFGGLEHIVISARPIDLGVGVNLEARLKGQYNFEGKDWASQEFELLTIPLPSGWRIPGVLTFGPNAKLFAGYELQSISGSATVTAGASLDIPDSSIAELDILSDDKFKIEGWVPQFNVQPPTLEEGTITAKGRIYGKVAVAVELEVLDEDGVTADVYVQVPLSLEAEVGYEAGGFCELGGDPYGFKLDVDVGAVIGLEAYKEINGKKDVFFNTELYKNYDVVELPEICIAWGAPPAGSCIPLMDGQMQDWYDVETEVDPGIPEDDDDDDFAARKRALEVRAQLEKRADSWDYYNLKCDPKDKNSGTHSKYKIKLRPYPGPTKIEEWGDAAVTVPIMKVGIDGCSNPSSIDACKPVNWVTTAAANDSALNGEETWSTEHVYEGSWVRDFLDHLQAKYFNTATGCADIATAFKIGQSTGYTFDMLNCLGTTQTYMDRMTLFPLHENGIKYRMFAPGVTSIDTRYDLTNKNKYSAHDGACELGRMVATCGYMEDADVQARLKNSIQAMDAVMVRADADTNMPKPAGLASYQAEHKAWFTNLWAQGINKLQTQLVDAAKYLVDPANAADYAALPQEIRTEVDALVANGAAAAKALCGGAFTYP